LNISNHITRSVGTLLTKEHRKWQRFSILLFSDLLISLFALFLAIQLRFGFHFPWQLKKPFWLWVLALAALKFVLLYLFRLYSFSLRFVGIVEFFRLLKAFVLFHVVLALGNLWLLRSYSPDFYIPTGVVIIDSLISFSLFGFIRLIHRLYFEFFRASSKMGKRTLIVGANIKTERLIKDMRMSKTGLYPWAVADESSEKLGKELYGLPLVNFKHDFTRTIRMNRIETGLINLPKAGHKEVSAIFSRLKQAGVNDIRIVPRMDEWKTSVHQIRRVDIEDLLSRQAVRIESKAVADELAAGTVLVTGAAGSIGSEIVRKLSALGVKRLVAFDSDESGTFQLQQELECCLRKSQEFSFVVGSIRDAQKLRRVFSRHRPQLVFHAAAYKHVPLMEAFPEEALRTNVIGTLDLARMAIEHRVGKFVNISTDKAVKPCSAMGASKRLAEMACQSLNGNGTRFLSVRFGNVLGSRGSVVPLFQEQIRRGGPLTLTHPNMRRYFMSIPEAVLLVFQAAHQGLGGEVFVLDMGDPVRIQDLAENLIRLNGLEPGKDIEIVTSGIRPGEKLFEELLTAEEGVDATSHDKIYVARFKEPLPGGFVERLAADCRKAEQDPGTIRSLFAAHIPSYCQQ
jgi:FlaA1/EpsC-like NDP-sugar epimerase